MRRLDNYHLMIIFHIIQNISYFLEEKMMYTKNLTSVTLSGRLEKVYDGIFLSVENMILR